MMRILNTLKIILVYQLLILLSFSAFCQNDRSICKNSDFVCKSDCINYYSIKKLIDGGVTQIMNFHYEYDNGRVSDAVHYIIWLQDDKGYIKKIKGCNHTSTKELINVEDIDKIFEFYTMNRIDTITRELKPRNWQSHDMGYNITVLLPGITREYNIRDYMRKENNLSDPRVLWVNMFEIIILKN